LTADILRLSSPTRNHSFAAKDDSIRSDTNEEPVNDVHNPHRY